MKPQLHLAIAMLFVAGCGSGGSDQRDFSTSGSREADQRAEQRMARHEQMRGEPKGDEDKQHRSLYDRLGGEAGVATLVDDFINRALADPRVNWERKGIRRGGVMGIGDKSVEWEASQQNIARLKKHISQFIALATGGPAQYEGREMAGVHEGMSISNAEFDAAVGDLKATLDANGVGTEEQKELLAIIESTRPQVVEKK